MKKISAHVVTIDGPAGGGKSTTAKNLAKRLNFDYLDTGAMYRTAALLGIRRRVDWNDPDALVELTKRHSIKNRLGRTTLDGEDVSEAIRTNEVTQMTHFAADNPKIREIMVRQQRENAVGRNLVTEGRDQGSVVFPDACCKFYLFASVAERAKRRLKDMKKQGESADFNELTRQIQLRDERDSTRTVGPLRIPDDAITIDSGPLTADEVVDQMEKEVRRRLERQIEN